MSADKHLTIPGALELDSGSVERFTIATLRYAGGSEHDVRYVSERDYDAALAREAALREELARYKSLFGQAQKAIDRLNDLHPKRMGELAKRLTVAEQLLQETSKAILRHQAEQPMSKRLSGLLTKARVSIDRHLKGAALKPEAEGEGS